MTSSRVCFGRAATLIGFLLLSPPIPTFAAEAEPGLKLANRLCSECHIVEDDKIVVDADVPSFEEIANHPEFDPEELRSFLDKPHPMPNMDLSPSEVRDLARYISSLKN